MAAISRSPGGVVAGEVAAAGAQQDVIGLLWRDRLARYE
jgi:hypothetical protein